MCLYVRPPVCLLSVSLLACLKNDMSKIHEVFFLVGLFLLPVAMAWSSYDSALCYVLTILWMAS